MKPVMKLLAPLALLAAPPALADVNIYTSREPSLLEPVVDLFTQETGIWVNLAYMDAGIAERLKAEGARSPADLVMTVDISNLVQIEQAGVLQPIHDDVLDAAIPPGMRDPDGFWYALTRRARVIYVANDRVSDDEITTYEDLVDPKWRGRICSRSGLDNYNLALLSAMIAHHGEEYARTWAAGLRDNLAHRPEGNDTSQVKSIWAGECDIALANTYYMGQMLKNPEMQDWAHAVHIVFPHFEGGGTHVNISGIAMTAAAPNYDEAIQLLHFFVSPEAQAIYAESNNEYPVQPDAPVSDLVASWGSFTPDDVSLSELAEHRATALRIMEEVNFDG